MNEKKESYNHQECEERWYSVWEEKGFFKPEIHPDGTPYSIVIPPPNVTGFLHMGHALNATLQDILIRWMRMNGKKALWVPGTDHAGIATQNVVEKKLREEGLDRHGLGREEFIDRVWLWKHEYGDRITYQLRKIGASADWSRQRFTLDEGLSRAVRRVFVSLYDEGLIYRATRLINWCPRCHTALSDIEVEHEDTDGTLTYISYPSVDGKNHVIVATTRPETMLGDTAVAVHPLDERFSSLIGKNLALPLTGRTIPVVADDAVEMDFGTGAVKVTPAHDFNDEAIARRQTPPLKFISVIGADGKMTAEAGGRYSGLDRYECRKKVLEDLESEGLIEKVENHQHAVGSCYRCRTVIEPHLTPQWYVKVAPLAREAIEAVRDKRIRILPEGWENSYFAWMENIRDWCVSRQIWWGHRIPVWYCGDCQAVTVSETDPEVCSGCGSTNIEQDPDVLDTWFSSALWPFSTLGWPEQHSDLKAFYPTSVLVTAFDILFFWVARMIMMGLKFMGDVPFKDVYIHALIRDADGRKMSKSIGNVIDPLEVIERFGADAFRFTLAAFAAQGRDIKFSEERVVGYRHFINKLFNATRYIELKLEGANVEKIPEGVALDYPSRWILSRLAVAADEINRGLTDYRFNDAAQSAYRFVWNEMCDWYIEMSKTGLESPDYADGTRWTLLYVLQSVLRLLHPFMPFVTEELWHTIKPLGVQGSESVVTAHYPRGLMSDPGVEAAMKEVMDAVTGARNIRGELNVPPSSEIKLFVRTSTADAEKILIQHEQYIRRLVRASELHAGPDIERPEGAATAVREHLEVYVPLSGLLDIDTEIARLDKELGKIEASLVKVNKKLHNQDFIGKAPAQVIEKEKGKLDELASKKEKLLEGIERLKGLK